MLQRLVDCLYLLDGNLDSLSTLIINVGQIFYPILDIDSRVSYIKYNKLENVNTNKISPLYRLAMRHADDEHMMIHNYINNDDDDDDDQINQIKPDELKMELDFIEQLIRKTKYQLY
ncbi:unnamed protein product [Rotaria sp. Silwood2]|nr:unnamed protein product [Rotaria sp. Silwood2]CAF4325022.1 unnamed protein product [Rotaria sp. Silwood2]